MSNQIIFELDKKPVAEILHDDYLVLYLCCGGVAVLWFAACVLTFLHWMMLKKEEDGL